MVPEKLRVASGALPGETLTRASLPSLGSPSQGPVPSPRAKS